MELKGARVQLTSLPSYICRIRHLNHIVQIDGKKDLMGDPAPETVERMIEETPKVLPISSMTLEKEEIQGAI